MGRLGINGNDFILSPKQEAAALAIAKDEIGDRDIARQVGCGITTLQRWKKVPAFLARVEEHRQLWRDEIREKGLADRQNRVDALNDRWRRMQMVIDERADDPSLKMVPGGSTGLIVHDVKGVGKGEDFQLIDIYGVDTGLLKEFREHEKQAAQELGQWSEKRELTGENGAPLFFTIAIDRRDDADDLATGE